MTPNSLRARVLGTGRYLPSRIVTNAEITTRLETTDAWIREHVGVERRHVLGPGETTSDMAAAAAREAMEAAGIVAKDLEMILLATVTGDSPMPATAAVVQQKIGAELIPSLDINASFSGFLYAMAVAAQAITARAVRTVLVVGVDALSLRVAPEDRTGAAIFGDGAGAVVLGASEDGRGILSMRLGADGAKAKMISLPGGGSAEPMTPERLAEGRQYLHMEGRSLFAETVKQLPQTSLEALKAAGLSSTDLDWVVPQQGNHNLVDRIAEHLGYGRDRFIENLATVGNTGAASIPIALDEGVRDGRIREGQNVLLCALGAGLTWGAAVVRM